MNYKSEDLANLAKGVYPQRCVFGNYSETCIVDKGQRCGINGDKGKEDCHGWAECNIFDLNKVAQDFVELTAANAELTRERDEVAFALKYKNELVNGAEVAIQSAESRGYLKAIEDAVGVVKKCSRNAESIGETVTAASLSILADKITALAPKGDTCEWKDATGSRDFSTTCGKKGLILFPDFKHCPYCGLTIAAGEGERE